MNLKFAMHRLLMYSPETVRKILDENISKEDVFELPQHKLWLMNIFTPGQLYNIEEIKRNGTEEDEKIFEKSGMKYVCIEDDDYPQRLRNISTPPYGVFYYGHLPPESFGVGVVGSRNTGAYGSVTAYNIGRDFALRGISVISGLARGVDVCSHRGALEAGGYSAGVLGCGADECYPRENIRVYKRLKETGGIISEFFPGTGALRSHFPMRNRIISALSDVLIVVEAREKSGSLITAAHALEQGREIYAVPGEINSRLAAGTNYLISQGAGVYTSADDLLDDLSVEYKFVPEMSENRKPCLAKSENMVYSVITLLPKSIDEIMTETGLEIKEVLGIVGFLASKGYIAEIGKNMYVRLGR